MTYTPVKTLTFDEFSAQHGNDPDYDLIDGALGNMEPTGPHEAVAGKAGQMSAIYTEGWEVYQGHLDSAEDVVSKRNTQKIEHKHLTLRTRIKRLACKNICFSKSVVMHDIFIGLFINRFEFGRGV